MAVSEECPVCNTQCEVESSLDPMSVNCPRCGRYKVDKLCSPRLQSLFYLENGKAYLISAWIREQNEREKIPEIDSNNLERLKRMPIPTVSEKLLFLMQALERRSEYPGTQVDVTSPAFIALAWCKNQQELIFNLKSLEERELLKITSFDEVMITAKGWDFLEENKHKGRGDSKKVFIAMSFDESMDSAYDAIYEAIKKTGYKPIRIDRVEHIDKIDDRIIADIKSSKFLVADLTGQNNGVYYEAGFARGRYIPVIWCVRKDELEKVHFDIRQFNCIVWEDEKDLKEKLINRIKAVID